MGWIPNALTIARLAMIPAFVALVLASDGGHSWPAAIIFGVAGVTDQIDGWLARLWRVESSFGKIADPLADRLMIDAAVILLWQADRLPWIALAIPARDVALVAGYKLVVGRGYDFSVNFAGKVATWLLYASLAFVMVTREESPLGTAGSMRLAGDRLDDTFLVISGDALCDVDLTELIRVHKEKGAAVTIGLKSVENPLEFGIVVTDEEGRIERFLEKPSWGQVFSDTINTGIYVIEPEALRHVPTDRPYDFSKELFPLLLEMGRPLYGHVLDGYWQDIGNLDQFRQANFDALDERVRLNINGIRLRGNIWLGEGVEVDDLDAIEGPAFLGNYCRVAPDASVGAYSVLGTSVTLLERARTERSVIDAATHIGRSARVEGAVVGRACDIRAHAHVNEGAAIGDEVTLGAQSAVLPQVR